MRTGVRRQLRIRLRQLAISLCKPTHGPGHTPPDNEPQCRRSLASHGGGLLCSPPFVFRFRASSVRAGVLVTTVALTGCAGWRDYGDTYYAKRSGDAAKRGATYHFGVPTDPWRPVRDVSDIQVAWVNAGLDGVGHTG